MKRKGCLFEQVVDLDNIILAHRNARKGKTHYRQVQMVDKDVVGYCTKVREMLLARTYTTSSYHSFTIVDNDKQRDISELPYYPDRIIQWALLQVLSKEVFCKHFIAHTYAAIPGRGTHAALRQLHSFMKDIEGTAYCLKLDIKKYFPSIDANILKSLLRKAIKCSDTLWLLDDIIDSYSPGIPIGNFTSQYLGNFYLSCFDHWMKEQKHIHYYLRYMDDIVILHRDKQFLHELFADIESYLSTELLLTVKENWQIFPTYVKGIDFVGYRSFKDFTLLRTRTKKRLKHRTKRLRQKQNKGRAFTCSNRSTVAAYDGILRWGTCNNLRKVTLDTINFRRT